MNELPVVLGWLIMAGFILMPAMAYLASYEAKIDATRWHRKWVKEREAALKEAEQMLANQAFFVDQRKAAVQEAEVDLGRKAHDLAAQTQVVLRQASSRDAVPTMQEL